MPDPVPSTPASENSGENASKEAPVAPSTPANAGPTINIGDEFGTAKKNLPPAKIVAPAVAVVLIIVAIVAFTTRAKPQGTGTLTNVQAVQVPDQTTTLAALTFTLRNGTDKILYVHSLQGTVSTPNGDFSGDAVSAVDFDRYFQAFPELKNGSLTPLVPETQIGPGKSVDGTIIVSFPVNLETFNRRKSVSAVIQPYDEPLPITLTK